MAEIRLDQVAHRYDDSGYALHNIDLTWQDGGAYALLGPSGCGKTTMLNIISGLLAPSEGQVLFDGVDVSTVSTADRNIAQVFQFPVLYESMTVEQNLRFPLRNRGVDKATAQKRAEEICELLELGDLRRRKAKGLSADAKQLVSLGRALVRTDVAAILFDEPLTVIDPARKWEIRQALKRVHHELSHTLVYVTHDQTEALTFADEVVVMNEGSVMQRGTPDDLFERPCHRFVGNFIGSPGMNFLPAVETDGAVGVGDVMLLTLPAADVAAPDPAPEAGPATLLLGIRPEFVRCHLQAGPRRIAADVVRVQDLGTAVQVEMRIDGEPITAKLPADSPSPTGVCWVTFDPDHLALFRDDVVVDGTTAIDHSEVSGK